MIKVNVKKGNKYSITKGCKNPRASAALVKYKQTPGKRYCNSYCTDDFCNAAGDCDEPSTTDGK